MKKIIIVCYMLCFLLGIFVYQFIKSNIVKPPVKVESITEVKYLLAEKKECEEKGGIFHINPYATYPKDYKISCKKSYEEGNKIITEIIFDYEI